jgi:cytochrome c-type biogenesis protein CcmH/NrfG
MLGWLMCGSMPDRITWKSNSLVGVLTNTASLCLRSIGLRTIPMICLSKQSAEEAGDITKAERLYRILLKSDPTDASAPFNLGNLLRATGRNVEAEAALRLATRADPTFADAWYNLSDLLDEQGRGEAAIDCLRTALRVAPDYVDAMFNLALLLQRTSQYAEAADYWRRYLATDCQSEWAAQARRSLKFCEMQNNLIASA